MATSRGLSLEYHCHTPLESCFSRSRTLLDCVRRMQLGTTHRRTSPVKKFEGYVAVHSGRQDTECFHRPDHAADAKGKGQTRPPRG